MEETLQFINDLYDELDSLVLEEEISSELLDCVNDVMEPLGELRKCMKREI